MGVILEVIDKTGRRIRLTKTQWSHINRKHPVIANYSNEIIETIKNPDSITESDRKDIYFYYKHYKFLNPPYNYILVIVKHLNGDGFVITAYLEKSIK